MTAVTAVTREHAKATVSVQAVPKRKPLYYELANVFGVQLKGMCGMS